MRMRHLHYFLVLAEELHFGRAAERLHISQPPLSRQIKELETDLGVLLFHRNKRNVELTESGLYLQREARRLLLQIDYIRDEIKRIGQGETGQLKIGYVGAAMHSVLPAILGRLRNKHPGISTLLYEMGNEEQITALLSGQIDAGFLRTLVTDESLCSMRILEETFSLILSQNHPLADQAELDLKILADEPFIGFSHTCCGQMLDSIFRICGRAGFVPRVQHQTSQINSIIRLVESGLGYSIVPSSVGEAYRLNVRFFELDRYPERADLFLVYAEKRCAHVENLIECARA